jgi:inosine-uridine nucleoside N-ribohydrolase
MRWLALLAVVSAAWAAGPETVVFDTDSGAFGDDGAALVMLLRSPDRVTVAGVTLTPGNVWPAQGAEYTLHILDLLRRPQVAVYTGAETPLLHSPAMAGEFNRRWGPLGFTGAFAENPADVKPAPGARLTGRRPRPGNGIEFLISEIERRPGEVTVLATGPMTNIALALRMKPSIETRIKRIVFMGGNVAVPGNASAAAEFNFWFDPEAARMVLRSRIPQKIMFALDVCNTAPIHKAEFDRIAGAHTPIADLFREDLGNRYPGFLKHPEAVTYLWDSLAAAYLLDPGYVTKWETRYLDVVTVWDKFYGATVPLDRRLAPDATPVTLATGIDFARVFALLKDRLTRRD